MMFLQKLLCGSAKRRERGMKGWGGVERRKCMEGVGAGQDREKEKR